MQTSYQFRRNHRNCSQYAGEPKLQIRVQPQRESQGYHGSNRGQRFNRGTDEDPRALSAQIKDASTIVELLSTHRAHESRLNHIHLSACWTSLAQLARLRLAERCWLQRRAGALEPLVQHTVRAAMKGQFDARALANVAYGAA